jgi:hypothetical protein
MTYAQLIETAREQIRQAEEAPEVG